MGTQFLQLKDGKIAYEDTGSGPLVIAAPIMGDLRAEYRFLIPQLAAAGYRVASMDMRGHGDSSSIWPDYSKAAIGGDMLALIRSLNAGPAVILGASYSGGSAVWAAAEAPEMVSGLVLLDPFVRGSSSLFLRLSLALLFTRPWGPAVWRRYYASLYASSKPQDLAEYGAAIQTNLKETGRMEALRTMMFTVSPLEEQIARVTAPALVIMGSRDHDFKDPEGEARWVAQALRGEYRMVAGAGHIPQAEMPEVTGELILSFLRTLKEKQGETYAAQG
jgi:pimeloyl-ACP methyl ester carboxylesterase